MSIFYYYLGAQICPLIQYTSYINRKIDAAMRVLTAKAIVPVGSMDNGTALGKVQIPRNAR
jgi:hypothetical protein